MNHNSSLISIIVPTKDRCSLLGQTIDSVRSQTYENWQLIVVDDASTDSTVEYVSSMTKVDRRIQLLQRVGEKTGAPVCRNQGFAASKGDYIIFLDSDDCLSPTCLEQRSLAMQNHPTLDFAIFPCQLFRDVPGDTELLWNLDTQEDDLDRFLNLDVPWQTTSPIWTRQALHKLGEWDEDLPSWQDWEFHIRALAKGMHYARFAVPDCFWRKPTHYTIGKNSKSAQHLISHQRLLLLIEDLLITAQALSSKRKQLLAGLYFWIAEQWLVNQQIERAQSLWRISHTKAFINKLEYFEGSLYFKFYGHPLGRRILRKYLKHRWSKRLTTKVSSTLRNAPLKVSPSINTSAIKQSSLPSVL